MFRGVEVVRVRANEHYKHNDTSLRAETIDHPFRTVESASFILEGFGFEIIQTTGPAQAELLVTVVGSPNLANYSGGPKYAGSTCGGHISLQLQGGKAIRRDFGSAMPAPKRAGLGAFNTPAAAPYYDCLWKEGGFSDALVQVIGEQWGEPLLAVLLGYSDWRVNSREETIRGAAKRAIQRIRAARTFPGQSEQKK